MSECGRARARESNSVDDPERPSPQRRHHTARRRFYRKTRCVCVCVCVYDSYVGNPSPPPPRHAASVAGHCATHRTAPSFSLLRRRVGLDNSAPSPLLFSAGVTEAVNLSYLRHISRDLVGSRGGAALLPASTPDRPAPRSLSPLNNSHAQRRAVLFAEQGSRHVRLCVGREALTEGQTG